MDPLIAAEDRELKRLEKLLGIAKSSNKSKAVGKLSKELVELEVGMNHN